MLFRIAFMISFLSLCFTNTHAQAAPDLGILWQKEYPLLNIQYAKFSHDGKYIYYASGPVLGMLSDEGDTVSGFNFVMDYYAVDMNITEDGKYLAVTSGEGTIYIFSTQTKELVKEISDKTLQSVKFLYHSDISPDGNFLYISIKAEDNNYYILIYNLQQEKEIKRLKMEGHVTKIKSSHDGRYFASGIYYQKLFDPKYYNKLILWETGTWKEATVLEDIEGQNSGYRHIKFSPKDQYLGSVRMNPYDAHIFDLNTNELVKTSEISRLCSNIEFLPDNIHFLLGYGTWGGDYDLELHDFNSKLINLKLNTGILESYDSIGLWKIICGYSNKLTKLTNNPTSVSESILGNKISFTFENGKVVLKTKTNIVFPFEVSIYDLIGNVLYSENITEASAYESYMINVNLPSGLYIGKIISGGNEYSIKFEVAR